MNRLPLLVAIFCMTLLNSHCHIIEHHDRIKDEKIIREHIDKIVRAYIRKDRAVVRSTHGDQWRGFLSGSTKILRGIDDYMKEVDGQHSIDTSNPWRIVDYKMLDYDIDIRHETAVVLFIAEFFWESGADKGTYKLRSMDIYGKEKGEWIQIGSNIGPLPIP